MLRRKGGGVDVGRAQERMELVGKRWDDGWMDGEGKGRGI